MLTKQTEIYANHTIPLPCDIYTDASVARDDIAFLYFHPGGLVDWGRDCIAPWLVQMCQQRQWPLISASYRLMPQVGSQGLVDDATAAYMFARKWNLKDGVEREVIVGGASAGFFLASQIAHHVLSPKPLALFSISGVNTFRHAFFNSSNLLTPNPIPDADMEPFLDGPIVIGTNPEGSASTFVLDKLLPDGKKNPDWQSPTRKPVTEHHKGDLWDYYIHRNQWVPLVRDIDPGYEWATLPAWKDRVEQWPPTVIFHGDADVDVPLDLSLEMQRCLGEDKVEVVVVEGQPHLFELTSFIEDQGPQMDAVRKALASLTIIEYSSRASKIVRNVA